MKNADMKSMIQNQQPKVQTLQAGEQSNYQNGLMLLSTFACEHFLDLPVLPEDRFSTDGLFYTLPFLHDDALYQNGRSQILLVAYQVRDGASDCPLRIEFELLDEQSKNFVIYLYDQSGPRTKKYRLIELHNGSYFSERKDLLQMPLSELVQHFA